LDFRSDLKTGTASRGHFSVSEALFSPDLRTWACQSLGHNPLISLGPILAGFVFGSRAKTVTNWLIQSVRRPLFHREQRESSTPREVGVGPDIWHYAEIDFRAALDVGGECDARLLTLPRR